MIASRRNFLFAGASFFAAPSIIRVASLMPVSVLRDAPCIETPIPYDLSNAGMYCGAFEPKFSAPHGSLYLCTAGTGRLYVNVPDAPSTHPSLVGVTPSQQA